MLLLALDTSTRYASVALCSENELLSEYTWFSENNHSVDLLDRIQRMMAQRQLSLRQLDAIGVALGPGSFNGVRVALSSAKALAFSLQKPLLGIGTLDVLAAQQQLWRGPICSVLEAGRSELYAGCYFSRETRTTDGEVCYHLQQVGAYQLATPQALVDFLHTQLASWPVELSAPVLFCGEMKAASRQALHQGMAEQGVLLSPLASTRSASVLAQLAWQRLQDGQADDPLVLEPLYLRRPSITKSTRKQPLLGGSFLRSNDHDTTEREQGALRH
ncbi:tRNA (adenosine(37)-N6)-threonylcarbamoyltransferase complex dimerization subunit type 1 TsaB [Dictyobacter aurantiacus]|uniref:tRNA (Adenosine(37)-N6)-threonylcarbamoyltransferase complex dimerization subunit type 1 TsaB n=1 Tax=Dictyobacter aurantiacus TaxID=1936993 RepID=A0A401ZHX5_9CHLR|nr:tRNA (adenosine(37)-N6)-threonylcarbamoyltransferase complex dimerization subunit type 1 TsaB [Dictyobacter aurantiacus]GCE06445.1 tRNA (adenosine(37)-N6)-threonylcarbamoyltransferase complex dimerization subunit type 1 TsaB [Dictyobacter aurantiacus]